MPALAPPVPDETEGLLTFLGQMRDALRAAAFGLDRDQLTATPTPSALSIAGLIKHTTFTEEHWVQGMLAHLDTTPRDYEQGFVLQPDESLDEILALQQEVASKTEEIVRALPDLDYPVPVPKGVPWFPDDVDAWSARWVLLHLIQELGRHAGHADIIREAIDGSNAFVLITKMEGENPAWLEMMESR
jgi:uncharacterized damage-inducible protein DinB